MSYETEFPYADMCATLHKVLSHIEMILDNVPKTLTLGHFSEEPLEASHKKIREFEVLRSCQKSRNDRMKGVIQRLLDGTAPQISAKIAERQRSAGPKSSYSQSQLDLVKDNVLL